ncbi:Fruit-body specific protein a [Mycena venus]|uniref:Fruit-body specific protein a n=1 Tax=Mycena venus TaxID=2733690 RepID=A0A8H7DEE9_9AGAR|nr:Fruit-body specific protein a [Mycena venus]
MRFTTLFSALCVFAGVVSASTPKVSPEVMKIADSINQNNCYGAPIPPWEVGCSPGWYYGRPEYRPLGLPCLVDGIDGLLCFVLRLIGLDICPHVAPPIPPTVPVGSTTPTPPPPPKGYSFDFNNLTCAAEVWPPQLYLTYGIVESIEGCANMCDSIPHCAFANCYHDVNAGTGKNNTNKFTCALFTVVLTAKNATNCGGQQQKSLPAGTTYITDSCGLVKDGVPST